MNARVFRERVRYRAEQKSFKALDLEHPLNY
jgi:hypothetical protein